MSEYRFRANGLNHDENLRCKTTLGTQTEVDLRTNHPDTSIRSTMIDDRDKWFQANHPRNERNRDDTFRQPRLRQKQLPSTEEEIWRAHEKKSTDQDRQQIIHMVSWDDDEEHFPALQIEKGSNKTPTNENRRTNLPTIVEEEEGYKQPHIEMTLKSNIQKKAFDSQNMRNEKGEDKLIKPHKTYTQMKIDSFFDKPELKMEIENETTDTDMEWNTDEMDEFLAEELAIIEMIIMEEKRQSSITEYFSSEIKLKTMKDTEHNPDDSRETTMLQIICGMQECNNRLGYKRIGKAVRMIALLRRCLYPKRDVIRWEMDKNEYICPRRVHSFEESLCPGTLKKSLSFRFVVLKASPTSVGKTKDSGIDFSISSFLQL